MLRVNILQYIRKIVLDCEKHPQNDIFTDFWDFVEYSTGVEYSGGHEIIFDLRNRSRLPKKFSCQTDE